VKHILFAQQTLHTTPYDSTRKQRKYVTRIQHSQFPFLINCPLLVIDLALKKFITNNDNYLFTFISIYLFNENFSFSFPTNLWGYLLYVRIQILTHLIVKV
jgi:hypothetical protein